MAASVTAARSAERDNYTRDHESNVIGAAVVNSDGQKLHIVESHVASECSTIDAQ